MSTSEFTDASLVELFRQEAETLAQALISGLLALEHDPAAAGQIASCMRAAHSLKGAARAVDLGAAVQIAHAMEDCFVAASKGSLRLDAASIDPLLKAVDVIVRLAVAAESGSADAVTEAQIEPCLSALARLTGSTASTGPTGSQGSVVEEPGSRTTGPEPRETVDRVLRVTAENLNRLLGLAGESLVESRRLKGFAASLLQLKRLHRQTGAALDVLRDRLAGGDDSLQSALTQAQRGVVDCQHLLTDRIAELEMFDRRAVNLSHRLYDEALACRMRPFADGIPGLPRMVRDLALSLGKRATLDISGEMTQVDRDILSSLDAPLGHLLRNAVDHGIETPAERQTLGKPPTSVIRLEARHSAGALHVVVADDGRGIDIDALRAAVVERGLASIDAANNLTDAELLEFLFLPGFSMKRTVTDISGRGVGLDVVRDMVRRVRGVVRVSSERGRGTRFELQLPVTLSVVRTLLVEIGGEPYAFPLASLVRTLKVPHDAVASLEGWQHVHVDGRSIGLVPAHQVLETGPSTATSGDLPVVVIGDASHTYGLQVDRFLGERELVVQSLDSRLGKIRDIAAGALMEDGSPVLIVDVEDLIRSIDKLVSTDRLDSVRRDAGQAPARSRKRVLVVDDSLTVRELERKLLENRGYAVEVAVDGMDGWNAVRTSAFDLVVSDIDMPRMDGIELVNRIRKNPNLQAVPVMIVSYKDRDEDRQRGLEAGAARYLAKSSFHDDALLEAVVDLIGEAEA